MPTSLIYWFVGTAISFVAFTYWVIHEIRSVGNRSIGDEFGTYVEDEQANED